jgi:hypothetical protein
MPSNDGHFPANACRRGARARVLAGLGGVRGAARLAALAALVAVGAGCGGPPVVSEAPHEDRWPAPGPGSHVALAARLMAGAYSSAAQAAADPAYFDVRLHIVPIWTERPDGPWLYVEQAMASTPEAPYRQRIYHLVDHGAGVVESIVFSLPGDPLAFAGSWREPARLNALDPTLLLPRMGCSVLLVPAGHERFVGSTRGTDCLSDLRGATHATSEVTLTATMLESWDRGYDAKGQQVWGARGGPYRFVKEGGATP